MGTKQSVTVEVAGQKLSLRTDADEAYVRSLARYVTDKLMEVKSGSSRAVSTYSLAILVAMNIADDLFQERESARTLRRRVREKSRTILDLLERHVDLPLRDS